MRHANYIV